MEMLNSSTSRSRADDASSAQHIRDITYDINLYAGSLILFIGIIGNILNILILSQRSLRSNTCIMIFIGSSISGIITILSGLITRILSHWELDISETIGWVCKFRTFLLSVFRLITFWLYMLATIDRWIVSSRNARLRQLSSKKNVIRSIFFITILSIIVYIQVFYCYEGNLADTPLKCFNIDRKCRLINDLIFAIITILIPLIFIIIFGWMTILNIRSSQIRLEPNTSVSIINRSSAVVEHQRRLKNRDKSLFIMLLIQAVLFACLTFPMVIQRFYVTFTFTFNIKKSPYKRAIENLIYQVALLMTYIPTGMQFYVNILSGGRVFRKALIDLFHWIIQKIKCR